MVTIRPATPDDLRAVAEIHVASWRTAYRGIMPDALLAAKDVGDGRERWGRTLDRFPGNLLVAADAREGVVGFCYLARVTHGTDDAPCDGRVYALHVRPDRKRQGIGTQLLRAAFARLRALGCRSAIVWTLEGLAPSRRFYEALGGVAVRSKRSDFDGATVPEVAYAWDDLTER